MRTLCDPVSIEECHRECANTAQHDWWSGRYDHEMLNDQSPLNTNPGDSSPEDSTWFLLLQELFSRRDLSTHHSRWAMQEIMLGNVSQAHMGAFIAALTTKGPTSSELAGLSAAMRDNSVPFQVDPECIDIVGTGGDGLGTANISTMAAIVTASCGIPVVKHGSRAASSACGSADVLEALGIRMDLTPQQLAECLTSIGIAFCFAQQFHPALRHVAAVRRELRVPTVFNVLGPLANPARPRYGLVGCSWETLAKSMAEVFAQRGDTVAVVRGAEGLDELTTTGSNQVWFAQGGSVSRWSIDAQDFGIARAHISQLRGGSNSLEAADLVREVLSPQEPSSGAWDVSALRDVVRWNAAIAVTIARTGSVKEDDIARGLETVSDALDNLQPSRLLAQWRNFCARI